MQGKSVNFSSSNSSNQGNARRTNSNFHNYGPTSYSALAVAAAQGLMSNSPHEQHQSRLQTDQLNDKSHCGPTPSNASNNSVEIQNLNGTSLLAQRLAEHSSSHDHNKSWSDSHFAHIQNSLPSPASYSYSNNPTMMYDGTTQNSLQSMGCLSTHGTPLYMSTSNPAIVPGQTASSFSSNGVRYLSDQSGSLQDSMNIHSLQQQQQIRGYPPIYMQQPNYVEMNKHQQEPPEPMQYHDRGTTM
uniref:Uncharacterized protein n=1 Tax=Eucampia antarctica TaxID=49252 RepID=A0A7S2WLW4_9STRA